MAEEEVEALAELGVTINHAIGAIRQRDALLSGGATSLTFHVESDSTLSGLVTEVDAPLTVTDVSQQDDGTCAVFVALDVGADHDRDRIAKRLRNRTGASVLRNDTTGTTCVVTLGAESAIRQMVRHGVALQQVEIHPDSENLAVTVQLSYETELREYVNAVTGALDGVKLVAKHHQSVDWQSESKIATSVDDRLPTDSAKPCRWRFTRATSTSHGAPTRRLSPPKSASRSRPSASISERRSENCSRNCSRRRRSGSPRLPGVFRRRDPLQVVVFFAVRTVYPRDTTGRSPYTSGLFGVSRYRYQ